MHAIRTEDGVFIFGFQQLLRDQRMIYCVVIEARSRKPTSRFCVCMPSEGFYCHHPSAFSFESAFSRFLLSPRSLCRCSGSSPSPSPHPALATHHLPSGVYPYPPFTPLPRLRSPFRRLPLPRSSLYQSSSTPAPTPNNYQSARAASIAS